MLKPVVLAGILAVGALSAQSLPSPSTSFAAPLRPRAASALLTPAIPAAPRPSPASSGRSVLYWSSVAALAGADAADTFTSWNLRNDSSVRETRGLYGEHFGARGVAVKSGLLGVQLGIEWLVCRNHPQRTKYFTWMNFAMAGVYSWSAARNASLR
jgi:hypothetical protein